MTALAVPGAGASFRVRTESALSSSCRMSFSDASLCVWLYVYFARMFCRAGWNYCPKSSSAATLILAISVRAICGVEILILYVFMCAVSACMPSKFALIFLRKSNTKLIVSSS